MVARGQYVDTCSEELVRELLGHAEAASGVLTVGYREIYVEVADQPLEKPGNSPPALAGDYVPNEQDVEVSFILHILLPASRVSLPP